MTQLVALLGVLSISFSAVFVRMAAVSPVTATFFRALYAVPVLLALVAWQRTGERSLRERVLAFTSGAILALDLAFWHESIALIGVGLATVIANVQVVFVALAAWALWGERPGTRTAVIVAAVLGGIVLTSGLARPDAYGTAPALGAALGVLAGACYAGFLLLFRSANRAQGPTAAPLLDSTVGTVIGALMVSPFDARFSILPFAPAHYWLAALAVLSQVVGWLCIAVALPRLPALETSVLLLVQPVFTVIWGLVFFHERLSMVQWAGTVLVLAGVGAITVQRSRHP